ncbi:HNH endonuclease [Kingella kingae]|uniref:HNH endonuclease n=2 Tax=Kingella kingae TaxID=504 RepID=UPI00254D4304|nr:HNH endonuclease signature motif containing protein [Kingella kingae]
MRLLRSRQSQTRRRTLPKRTVVAMPLKTIKPKLKGVRTASLPSVKPADSWRGNKTSAQRGYGHKWRKARQLFLQNHPLCVYCQRAGKITPANVVDHIVPHQGNQNLFWDNSNWQALCSRCHSSVKQKLEKQPAQK